MSAYPASPAWSGQSASGNFSAAARRLGKSQSTISAAISNLEADLALQLFDRSSRQNELTPEGMRVLDHVKDILSASERLEQLSIRLADQVEPRLALALSDMYHFNADGNLTKRFAERFPDIAFDCSVGEGDAVITRLQAGEVNVGILATRADYPPNTEAARLPQASPFGIYVARDHPLTKQSNVSNDSLGSWRTLSLRERSSKPARLPVHGASRRRTT